MRKMEINNEIVLLRQSVRQARICIINKLIREAKRLRTSHGNEKQLEKNKNKADKLLREVFALKRIKDDEISKFGIVKFENLQDILQNLQTDDGTRAMAKVVRYKPLSSKITEFQEKFPDYNEHICWRKKRYSLKRRGNCLTDISEKHSKRLRSDTNNTIEVVCKETTKDTDDITSVTCISRQKRKKIDVKHEKLSVEKELDREPARDNGNSVKALEIHSAEVESKNGQGSKTVAKIINNEATVKRFTEILQETEEQNVSCKEIKNHLSPGETSESSKKMDNFFLHINEATSCSSVAPFSKEKILISSECNHDTFKSRQIRNKKDKLYNEKINKERRDHKRQKTNGTNVSHHQTDLKKRDCMHWKENRKGSRAEEKKGDSNNINAVEYETLHPSWVAKKKQQDIMKQGFQGKKIKFDEN